MQVKIGNKIYNSDNLPILLLLSDEEKHHISNMHPDASKYCSYNPKVICAKHAKRWMDLSFTETIEKTTDANN